MGNSQITVLCMNREKEQNPASRYERGEIKQAGVLLFGTQRDTQPVPATQDH